MLSSTSKSTRLAWLTWLPVVACLVAGPAGAQAQEEAAEPGAEVHDDPGGNFWQRVYAPNQQAFEAAMTRGRQALRQRHFKAAFLAFDEAASLDPDDPDVRLLAGGTALEAGEYARGVEHLLALRALRADADTELGVCFQLALGYAHLGRYRDGIGEYDRCIGSLPKDATYIHHNNVAELYMASGDLERAITHYRASIDGFPSNVHGVFGLAVALDRAGQPDEAQTTLLQGLRLDPSVSFMFEAGTFFVPEGEKYYHLGLMFDGLGRRDDALRYFEKYLATARTGHYHAQAQRHVAALEQRKSALVDTFPAPSVDLSAAVVDGELRWLAVGTAGGRISLVTLADGAVLDYRLEGKAIVDLAFTDKGELRVLQAGGEVLRLDPAKRLKRRGSIALSKAEAVIDLSADGAQVLGTSGGDFVRFDLAKKSGKPRKVAAAGLGFEAIAAMTPTSDVLAVAVGREGVYLAADGSERGGFRAADRVLAMEALPDGGGFVLGMHTGMMVLDLDDQAQAVLLPAAGKVVVAVALDPSGRYLTAVVGSSIEVWDLAALGSGP